MDLIDSIDFSPHFPGFFFQHRYAILIKSIWMNAETTLSEGPCPSICPAFHSHAIQEFFIMWGFKFDIKIILVFGQLLLKSQTTLKFKSLF